MIQKKEARKKFEGSNNLFDVCWKDMLSLIRDGMEEPESEEETMRVLDDIASQKVNSPRSKFYIYG